MQKKRAPSSLPAELFANKVSVSTAFTSRQCFIFSDLLKN